MAHFCYHCLKTEENKYTDVPPLIPLVINHYYCSRRKAKGQKAFTLRTRKKLTKIHQMPSKYLLIQTENRFINQQKNYTYHVATLQQNALKIRDSLAPTHSTSQRRKETNTFPQPIHCHCLQSPDLHSTRRNYATSKS